MCPAFTGWGFFKRETMFKKPKRIQSKTYLDWLKNIPCIICSMKAGYFPEGILSEPHHVPEEHKSIMGSKVSDYRAIPLCRICHQEYHDRGRETFKDKYNVDYEAIIAGLNKIYKEMEEVIENQNRNSEQAWKPRKSHNLHN